MVETVLFSMNKPSVSSEKADMSVLCAVLDDCKQAVVRVVGRGNFMNSVPFKEFADQLDKKSKPEQFIVDLGRCETMDSTFMGVLASISLNQTRHNRHQLIVVNANAHVVKLLKTLGLINLLDVQESSEKIGREALDRAENQLEPAAAKPVSHIQQISHTLEAHKTLVRVDDENELRFQSVIHYLEKSLKEEV